ncbi:unnamed protein product, partial [Owenia fusiformis]
KRRKVMTSNSIVPVFTGPFPAEIKEDIRRLKNFVNFIAFNADVKNRYSPQKLQEHISYIEAKVQTLCTKVGEYDSWMSTSKILRQGSSYKGTKILKPDELDYMPILAIFTRETVVVEDVKENCELKDKGCVYIKVNNSTIKDNLDELCHHTPSGSYLKGGTIYLAKLREAVKWALGEIDSLTYTGEHKHKDEDQDEPYPLGNISVCEKIHGPSITLKMGAPLCTAKVDLCFSIEGRDTNLGQCAMVSANAFVESSCQCGLSSSRHWDESPINPPNKYELSESHRELFLTFKLISHILNDTCQHLGIDTTFSVVHASSSYNIQSLVWQHQQTCQATNVGECYRNIVQMLNCGELDKPDELYVKVHDSPQGYLEDMFFPEVEREISPISIVGFMWFLQQVCHTESTEWWKTLFIEDDTRYNDNDHLSGLCEASNHLNELTACFSYPPPPPITLIQKWNNERNNQIASLTISRR